MGSNREFDFVTGVESATVPTSVTPTGADDLINLGFYATNYRKAVTSTATAAGTTTLTSSSTPVQIFTGATTQNCDLPDATTLSVSTTVGNTQYMIKNSSTGDVTVRNDGGTSQVVLSQDEWCKIVLTANGTADGTWEVLEVGAAGGGGITNENLRMRDALGMGSTDTSIVRFSTVVGSNFGTDITQSTTAGNGTQVTLNTAGVYLIQFFVGASGSQQNLQAAVTVNSTSLPFNAGGRTYDLRKYGASDTRFLTNVGIVEASASDVIRVAMSPAVDTGTDRAELNVLRLF